MGRDKKETKNALTGLEAMEVRTVILQPMTKAERSCGMVLLWRPRLHCESWTGERMLLLFFDDAQFLS